MKKRELVKRYGLFIISQFFSAFGVAFTKTGELGVSPIASVANVLSLRFEVISIGNWLIILNLLLLLGQVVLLRRNFKPIQLLQIPIFFLYGWLTDLGVWVASFIPLNHYVMRLAMVIFGVIVLGFGIALSVIANVILNAGEAFIKALADTLRKNFGNVKVAFDVSCVALSVVLSLLLFGGHIVGVREGTLIAAFCSGLVVKFFTARLRSPLDKRLSA